MDTPMNKRASKSQEIAQAALMLFVQKGYAATSMEQIASAAGIGKSTLYDYFKTKDDLFVAAVLEGAEGYMADLEAVGRETRDPLERLQRIAELCAQKHDSEHRAEARLFFEIISQTFIEGGAFYNRRHLIRNVHRRIVGIIVDYLLAGVSRKQLHPGIARHAEKIAINFLAFLDGLQMYGMIEDGYINVREQIEFYMQNLRVMLQPPNTDDPRTRAAAQQVSA